MKAEGKNLRERKSAMEAEVKKVEADLHAALLTIPNMTHPDAPVGSTPADNKVISRSGEPRQFDFAPKDHVALAEALDLVDFEAGAAVTGNKFYFLKNEGALLEFYLFGPMHWLGLVDVADDAARLTAYGRAALKLGPWPSSHRQGPA